MIRLVTLTVVALLFGTVPAHAENRPGYIAVGDSITAGIGTSDWIGDWPHGLERVQRKYSYPARAGVRDFAVGGSCLACTAAPYDILRWIKVRLNNVSHPVTVVAHIGINDLALGQTSGQVIANLRELRRIVEADGNRLMLGTIIPGPKDSDWARIQAERIEVNQWIRGRGHVDYSQALSCDRWLCPGLTDHNDPHLNNRGAKLMADALVGWIEGNR